VVPSWLGSLSLHSLCLAVLFLMWKPAPPRGDFPGNGGDSFREVGIRVASGVPGEESTGDPPGAPPAPSTPAVTQTDPVSIPALSGIALPLPEMPAPPSILGAGPATPSLGSSQIQRLIHPTTPGSGFGMGTGGEGTGSGLGGIPGTGGKGTSFIGIGATGTRFVYVIDRSSSMSQDKALQAAKLELLASLQQLDETQQFQVIFYNQNVFTLDTRGGRFDVFRGTDAHRLRVTEQIRDVTPSEGTAHLPAILEGLKFNPDVLFLLTDGAAESVLDKKDLDTIRRHNRGGTRIHCIEFGRGRNSPYDQQANFLVELAREHQGRYVYRDTRSVLMSPETP